MAHFFSFSVVSIAQTDLDVSSKHWSQKDDFEKAFEFLVD